MKNLWNDLARILIGGSSVGTYIFFVILLLIAISAAVGGLAIAQGVPCRNNLTKTGAVRN